MSRLKEINDRKVEIRSLLESDSTDVNVEEIRTELENLNKEEAELRSRQEIANKINVDVIETKTVEKPNTVEVRSEMSNDLDTIEYRNAFMNFVNTGTMKEEFRATAMTSANSAVIPVTTLNQIIEKMESYGEILPLVSKTAFASGLAIPTANMGITASWLAESKVADQQGAGTASITFGGYKLQARVGISLEMQVKSLSAFEAALINNVSKAMIKAIEASIISGTGAGQCTGITTSTVDSDRSIDVAKFDYKTITSAEAAVPSAYDSTGTYFMNKKTFMKYVELTDSNGQPIAKVNMGVTGRPERMLLGRPVVITEYLPAFDAAKAGDVFAFIFDMSNYVLNTSYDITVRQYIDEATDDTVTKATMIVDGKPVDTNGLVLLKKKVTA